MNGNQTFMLEVKNSNTTLLILPANRQYYTIEKQAKDNSLATVHLGVSGHLGSPLSCQPEFNRRNVICTMKSGHYIRMATIKCCHYIQSTLYFTSKVYTRRGD